eukprot:TRINITY_DN1536_c0_g2_i1.p1 TRINITY_DN1536_c0_g2~~TRINITY_DN1536_c0_g2_i1.p1  ORF type:complete len:608 (+),score=114.78 TRINITY_DN1536_c0_g2_i1:38-1825(+)
MWEEVKGLKLLEDMTSLQKVKTAPCVKQLRRIFEETGLGVSVGFNQGSGDLTMNLSFGGKTMEGGEKGNVVWGMLALTADNSTHPDIHLKTFTDSTKLCVVTRKYNKTRETVSIMLKEEPECSAPSLATFSNKTAKYKRLSYSPSYLDLEEGENTETIISKVISEIWSEIRLLNYIPSATLVDEVGLQLQRFFESGVKGVMNDFNPSDHFNIFLEGVPGVGKSEFVRVFSLSLEKVIRKYLDTTKRVAVVKVPLNSVTPDSLKKQAMVRGLSDHSIERIVEQTITNGDIPILHLEENPEDFETQLHLNKVVTKITSKITTRYPQYAGHLALICTTNHTKAPELETHYGKTVFMSPPVAADRFTWVVQKLRQEREFIEIDEIPENSDMRKLYQWCMTMGHHIQKHCEKHNVDESTPVAVEKISQERWKLGEEVLLTDDNLFCYPEIGSKIETVLDMLASARLSPAVILVKTPDFTEILQSLKKQIVGALDPVVAELSVLSDSDAPKVFGESSEIRGGLYKIIDDHTCPNSPSFFRHVAVFAHVSVQGQFILRELLEQGLKSRTHRIGVNKKGCLFVLTLEDGIVTPQMASRAHLIL